MTLNKVANCEIVASLCFKKLKFCWMAFGCNTEAYICVPNTEPEKYGPAGEVEVPASAPKNNVLVE